MADTPTPADRARRTPSLTIRPAIDAAARSSRPQHAEHDPFDALAELFLGSGGLGPQNALAETPLRIVNTPEAAALPAAKPSSKPEPLAPSKAPAPKTTPLPAPARGVEGLIVGHLPVLASAWVSQYAKAIVRERGTPVALIRLQAGQIAVEVFGPVESPATTARPPTLQAALTHAQLHASAWLIACDEASELDLASTAGLTTLTLLSSANDVAVIACYRAIKGVAARLTDSNTAPRLRVAVMGGPEDKAALAAEKIRSTAATFLSQDLDVFVGPAHISPGQVATLYRGPYDHPVSDVLKLLKHSEPTSAIKPEATSPALHREEPEPPTVAVKPATTQHAMGELWKRLDGLKGLAPRCPYAPSVELAVDRGGRLHLIAAAGDAWEGRSIERAVSDLTSATAWVGTHLALLKAAEHSLTSDDAPHRHLVTDRPREARTGLDAGLHVHVAARAGAAWTLIDLS